MQKTCFMQGKSIAHRRATPFRLGRPPGDVVDSLGDDDYLWYSYSGQFMNPSAREPITSRPVELRWVVIGYRAGFAGWNKRDVEEFTAGQDGYHPFP